MSVSRKRWLQTATLLLGVATSGLAAAFSPVPKTGTVVPGPGTLPPRAVWGKEYSHDRDVMGGPGAPVADPEQVIRWDGSGGTADGVDYSGSRPNYPQDRQVDAIANTRDALYNELLRDGAGLAFSHDDEIFGFTGAGPGPITVPSAGPIVNASGYTLGGAGELSMEYAGLFAGPAVFGTWAKQPEIDSRSGPSGRPMPRDVDGVEVWGFEPDQNPDFRGDADKYSLEIDSEFGFSVWNASGSPYLPHSTIVAAVESLLGPAPEEAFLPYDEARGRNAINIDALMVQDVFGSPLQFDHEFADPLEGSVRDQEGLPIELQEQGDSLIFSIRQMVMPDGSYYATGSELFVLDALTGVSFLTHGGHVWDSAFAMSELSVSDTIFEETQQEVRFAVLDINAIEAIGEIDVPPPVLSGDYNFDGKVDAADFTVWRDSKGAMGAGLPADGNGDGVIDLFDKVIWASNYGAMAPSPAMSSSAAVPEPTAVLLAGLAVAGVVTARRR